MSNGKLINYVLTGSSVVVVFQDGMVPIASDSPVYGQIKTALENKNFSAVTDLVDVAKRLVKHSGGRFYIKDGMVYVGGQTLPDALSKRLLAFADDGLDCEPLLKFWDNLAQNPSEDSKNDLYAFLEANNVPITADGCFLGYRKVRGDFKDIYTGKIDNSVGATVKVKRSDVDANRNNTCSKGLHVAAFDYAANQYGVSEGNILIEVKVNPKDVVTVPPDYKQQKMRVCEFTVVRVCQGEQKDVLYTGDKSYEDFMREHEVSNDKDQADDVDSDLLGANEGDNSDANKPTSTDYLSVDTQGRLCIPNRLVRKLGLAAGDTMYAGILGEGNNRVVILSSESVGAEDERTYIVDRDCNVRLSHGMLEDAGLGKLKNLAVDDWDTELEVRRP